MFARRSPSAVPRWAKALATGTVLIVAVAGCKGATQGHAQAESFASKIGHDITHTCVDAHGHATDAGTYDKLTIVVWNRDRQRRDTVRIETAANAKGANPVAIGNDRQLAKRLKDRAGFVGDLSDEDKANNPGSYTSASYRLKPGEIRRVFVRDLHAVIGKGQNVEGNLFNNECPKSNAGGGSSGSRRKPSPGTPAYKAKWAAICKEQGGGGHPEREADCRKRHGL